MGFPSAARMASSAYHAVAEWVLSTNETNHSMWSEQHRSRLAVDTRLLHEELLTSQLLLSGHLLMIHRYRFRGAEEDPARPSLLPTMTCFFPACVS